MLYTVFTYENFITSVASPKA